MSCMVPWPKGKCAAIEERQTIPLPLELPAVAQRPRRPVSRLRLGNDRIQGVGIAGRANREGLKTTLLRPLAMTMAAPCSLAYLAVALVQRKTVNGLPAHRVRGFPESRERCRPRAAAGGWRQGRRLDGRSRR